MEAKEWTPEERREALRKKAGDPRYLDGAPHAPPAYDWRNPQASARRAIDAAYRRADLTATGAETLDRLVRRDTLGADSRYIAAVSDPDYASAFAKLLTLGSRGESELARLHLTDREREAYTAVVMAAGPLNIGSGPDGGYAVPITLNPSVMPTSDGTVNPWRQIARTITLVGSNTWKGVSTDGVDAAYDAELAEVAESNPTLDQPEIHAEKAHAFCSFSIEVGQDWVAIRDELLTMLTDARDRKEGEKFLDGAGHGSDEPEGILTATGSAYETATTGTLDLDDVYGVKADLGSRFQPRARWLMAPAMRDSISRLVGVADPAEPPIFQGPDTLLRRDVVEVPDMSTDLSAGEQIAIYGDIQAGFAVVDRVGAQVELVPHLMGESRRPIGARGLYYYWRSSSGVLVENAFRILTIKT